jgi:Spy/CpxP family protein refolding chaperone
LVIGLSLGFAVWRLGFMGRRSASVASRENFMAVQAGSEKETFLFSQRLAWVSKTQTTSNSPMKSNLKLLLAAMLLGLPIAGQLRADDPSAPPAQTGPSIQPEPSTPPDTGEKPPPHPRMMDPQRMLQKLSDQVNLTDDQKAKILPLYQAAFDQGKALHDDASLSDDEKREKMRAIMQSTRKQIGDLLTPEQKEKLKELRAAHDRDNPPPPPPSADNPAPPDGPPPPPPAAN